MKIHLLRRQQIIEHDNRLPLLARLEQLGIQHEYQCRSGYCGACRVKLKKGRVSYKELPLAFLLEDEILLCCCHVEEDLEIAL